MEMQCWNYLDTVEVIGSIPVAPIVFLFRFNCLQLRTSFHARLLSPYFVSKLTKTKEKTLMELFEST